MHHLLIKLVGVLTLWFPSSQGLISERFYASMRRTSHRLLSSSPSLLSNDNDDITNERMQRSAIVVGAGIAGMTLALGLADLGWHVHLVERRSDLQNRRGGAYLMQPNAISALEEVAPDVMDELQDIGVLIPTSGKMYAWWMVRNGLLKEVEKRGEIALWKGFKFDSFRDEESEHFVEATFVKQANEKDEKTQDLLKLKGILLVGCDGVNSSVRASLGLAPGKPSGSTIFRGSISALGNSKVFPLCVSGGVQPLGYINCGPTVLGLLNFHSKCPGEMAFSVSTKDPTALDVARHPRDVVDPHVNEENEEAVTIFKEIFELAEPSDLEHKFRIKTIELPKRDDNGWGGRGRVTLVGDAAHAMRSAGGLGGAMAFEDTAVLLRRLKEVGIAAMQERSSAERHILEFESSRLPRVRTIWLDTDARAERAYQKGAKTDPLADKEYYEWVYAGV